MAGQGWNHFDSQGMAPPGEAGRGAARHGRARRGQVGQGKDMTGDEWEREAKLKIRNGLRLILQGIEDLWQLPRSFETKKEQGKR